MPLPAAAAPLLGPAAIKTLTAIAWEYGPPTITSMSLATVLVRQVYKGLPSWIKQDESFAAMVRAAAATTTTDKSNKQQFEILSLTLIIEKLQDLIAAGVEQIERDAKLLEQQQQQQETTTTNDAKDNNDKQNEEKKKKDDGSSKKKFHFHAAFLCYIQLVMQLKRQQQQLFGNNNTTSRRRRSSYFSSSSIFSSSTKYSTFGEEEEEKSVNANESSPLLLTNHANDDNQDEARDDDDATKNNSDADSSSCSFQSQDWKQIRKALEYAILAYTDNTRELELALQEHDYVLLHHERPQKMPPGFVGFFTAVSVPNKDNNHHHNDDNDNDETPNDNQTTEENNKDYKKTLLIGVKGTSSLEDLLTDCCGQSTSLCLDETPFDEKHDCPRAEILLSNINDAPKNQDETTSSGTHNNSRRQSKKIWEQKKKKLGKKKKNNKKRTRKKGNANNNDDSDEDKEKTKPERNAVEEMMESIEVFHEEEEEDVSPTLPRIQYRHEPIQVVETRDCSIEVQYYGAKVYCHEGILIAAKRLVQQILPTVQELVIQQGYRLVLCGHSLGAGAASLMALLLQSQFPSLRSNNNNDETTLSQEEQMLHVYAFAPPPVLDLRAAKACSPFITTIVNHCDLICRCSLSNLRTFLDFLRVLDLRYLEPAGLSPRNAKSILALVKQLCRGLGGNNNNLETIVDKKTVQENEQDSSTHSASSFRTASSSSSSSSLEDEEIKQSRRRSSSSSLLASQEQIDAEIRAAQERIGLDDVHNLYVPGKILYLSPDEKSNDKEEEDTICAVVNGAARPLRFFDIGAGIRLVTDHLTTSYTNRIEDMIAKTTTTTSQ